MFVLFLGKSNLQLRIPNFLMFLNLLILNTFAGFWLLCPNCIPNFSPFAIAFLQLFQAFMHSRMFINFFSSYFTFMRCV